MEFKDFEFESYEKYYGEPEQVQKAIEFCPKCGTRFNISHLSDCGNLLLHETARCLACDYGSRRLIHLLH